VAKTLIALLVLSAAVGAAAATATAARLAGCALVTTRDAQSALGGVYRLRLVEQTLVNVRQCSIRVVRTNPAGVQIYAVIRDWPYGGAKTAFDFAVKTLGARKQPKGVRFVSFGPIKGIGAKAYASRVVYKGKPQRSVLVWTGEDFVHVLNGVSSVTLPALVSLARDAARRA
jgi:hypothetical protein